MAWSVILSVYVADPIAEVKLFSILHITISCRLVSGTCYFTMTSRKFLSRIEKLPKNTSKKIF
jgi:hypothetical protein